MERKIPVFDVRLEGIDLENFKNVKAGSVTLPNASNRQKADVLGIYGQNGSGKTTLIDALALLKLLLTGNAVPPKFADFINLQGTAATVTYRFILSSNESDEIYKVVYTCKIRKEIEDTSNAAYAVTERSLRYKTCVFSEKLQFSHCADGKVIEKLHPMINTDSKELPFSPAAQYEKMIQDAKSDTFDLLVKRQIILSGSRSFVFSNELIGRFRKSCPDLSALIVMESLIHYGHLRLFVLDVNNAAMISLNLLPIAFHYQDGKNGFNGMIAIPINQNGLIPQSAFVVVKDVIKNMNVVLEHIIPGLTVTIEKIGTEVNKEGESFYQVQLFSNRNGRLIPLQYESEGIKKIVSILQLLINVYNEHAITVAIDEMDSGIFEYLLGELMRIISEKGRGQLIFTSHNLRPLETIDKSCIVFTTTNEEKRYIRPKNIKATNNLRDYYYRDITLGEQPERVYEETNNYEIALAFLEAGECCGS